MVGHSQEILDAYDKAVYLIGRNYTNLPSYDPWELARIIVEKQKSINNKDKGESSDQS